MTKIKYLPIALILISLMAFSYRPEIKNDCTILHEGTFTYGESDKLVKVVINGSKHIEYHQNGKYYIKSKIHWLNDCEYNMTMKKVTIPNFPYGRGDIMNVKISKVDGDKIYYTSTVKGQSWNGVLTKKNKNK